MNTNKKTKLRDLTNKELEKLLVQVDYCDKNLLREYDERCHDGRMQWGEPIPLDKLEEYIHERYLKRRHKKAS